MDTDVESNSTIFLQFGKLLRERKLVEVVQLARNENVKMHCQSNLFEMMAMLLMNERDLKLKAIEKLLNIEPEKLHANLLPKYFIECVQRVYHENGERQLLSNCLNVMQWLTRYEWKSFEQTDISKRFQLLLLFELEVFRYTKKSNKGGWIDFKKVASFRLLTASEKMARYGLEALKRGRLDFAFKFFYLSHGLAPTNSLGRMLGHSLFRYSYHYSYQTKGGCYTQLIKIRKFPYWRSIGTVKVFFNGVLMGYLTKEFLGLTPNYKYAENVIYEVELNEVVPSFEMPNILKHNT